MRVISGILDPIGLVMVNKQVAEEFYVKLQLKQNTLPLSAVTACVNGPHHAINPHRQRLLVAAHKATKAVQRVPNKGAPKGKAKPKKSATKPAVDTETPTEPDNDISMKKPNQEKANYGDVAKRYTAAKSQFLASTLGFNSFSKQFTFTAST